MDKMGIVGLTKVGRFGRWNVIYSNGTDKPLSWLWNIVPDKLRSYWLLYRRMPGEVTFDDLRKEYAKRNMYARHD